MEMCDMCDEPQIAIFTLVTRPTVTDLARSAPPAPGRFCSATRHKVAYLLFDQLSAHWRQRSPSPYEAEGKGAGS